MSTTTDQKLLRVKEAADRAGVDPATLRSWIKAGALPAVQVIPRGVLRVSSNDLDELLRPR